MLHRGPRFLKSCTRNCKTAICPEGSSRITWGTPCLLGKLLLYELSYKNKVTDIRTERKGDKLKPLRKEESGTKRGKKERLFSSFVTLNFFWARTIALWAFPNWRFPPAPKLTLRALTGSRNLRGNEKTICIQQITPMVRDSYHRQAEVASRGEMFHQPMELRDSTCSPPKPGWTRIARRSFPSSCPICNASTLMTRSCTLIARDASPNSTGGRGSRLMQASGQDSIAATFSDSTYAHIALRYSHHENTHKHKAPVSGLVPTWHSSIRNQLLYALGLCWVNSQPGHTTKKPTNQLQAHYSLELPLLPIGHLEMQFRCIL